jgi:DNA-binding GntR family transcriptional regulator
MREALRRLADEDVVTAVHGRGWFVHQPDQALTRTDEVANKVRAAIKSGELSRGSNLPGEKALAAEYGVSRVTVRRALANLETEGWVVKERGRGRVVAISSTDKGA